MNLPISGLLSATNVVALACAILLPASFCSAQGRYLKPTFKHRAEEAAASPTPAALLAGGPAAAQGNQFMDSYGNPIIMPASYCQSCPDGSGCYGGCYGGGYPGGYGDPMGVDFGGYGEDQCGPHYFDISAEVVFLQEEEVFENVGPLASVGSAANAPRILDPQNSADDYEPGWRIAARYDIGALALLEVTYMGLYDIGFDETVNSLDVTNPAVDFSLQSVFSNFGVPPIDGFDASRTYSLEYDADLQSTEISYRRYWVANNPRISGTWILGARYLRFIETLQYDAVPFNPVTGLPDTATRSWDGENDMVGFQFGGDGWICLRQGLRFGGETKAGIYNNRFRFRHTGNFPEPDTGFAPPTDFDAFVKGDQVAFAAQGSLSIVADILPSWSIRGGYEFLYMNSLATVGGNIDTNSIVNTAVYTQSDALFHGFTGGIEWIW